MASKTYYELLEIRVESSLQEINKAYRVKALRLHPDKNRNDPSANQRFHELSEAYAVLSDEKAKTLYDAKLKIEMEKQKRDSMLDAQRRAMRDSLLAREAEAKRHRMRQEEDIQAKFQAELERIRKRQRSLAANAEFLQKYAPEEMDELAPSASPSASQTGRENELTMRSIRVKWLKTQTLDRSALERTFGRYGGLEAIVVSSRGDGSAVILCESHETAMAIMSDNKSHWRQLYSVSWAKEAAPPAFSPQSAASARGDTLLAAAPFKLKSVASASSHLSFDEYEAQTLRRLRKQQELKRQEQNA